MKQLSSTAKVYIFSIIFLGLALIVWTFGAVEWTSLGLYLLAGLGAAAQTFKVEGPNDKTNYNLALFVYGFTFIALGAPAALIVIVVAHLVEWAWHKYSWYIQSFNIGSYAVAVFLAGQAYELIRGGAGVLEVQGAIGMGVGLAVFVLLNHLLVGVVIKLARGQSLAESGVFEFYSLFLDYTILAMGAVTALVWSYNPLASLLNILPLYLLYRAIQVPALERRVQELEKQMAHSGD